MKKLTKYAPDVLKLNTETFLRAGSETLQH